MTRKTGFALPLVAVCLLLAGCGGEMQLLSPRIDLQSTPVATYDPATGKTTVLVDFSVRDSAGYALDPAKTTLNRLVDGKADNESVANVHDEKLASNLTLGLVLDASYSMTVSQPAAFEPMKQAALQSEQSIRTQFASWNAGTFQSQISWFQDAYVCGPGSSALQDAAVLDIPTPGPGDATKLFAAAARMVDTLRAQYDAQATHAATDHYAVVLFTDGADNYSYFDSSSFAPKSYPAAGGQFVCTGAAPINLQDLVTKILAFPNLRVHVIGLGNQISSSELKAIADAGHGRFVSNPDPGQVTSLFAEVTRELTTLRRDGITMALQPGDYTYVEEVTANGGTGRVQFRFHAGDANAGVNASSISLQ